MKYISVEETAKKFNISKRRIQKLCQTGRIDGSKMISHVWVIPEDAKKPSDERYIISDYDTEKYVSLKELCKIMSISIATGKNWVKLGKIVPEKGFDKKILFKKSYAFELKKDLKSGKNSALKSRRNKKFVSGNKLYSSYVSDDSKNVETAKNLIDYINGNGIILTDNMISEILSCCAVSLLKDKGESINSYCYLIDDISKKYKKSEFNKFVFSYEKGEDVLGLLYISLKNIGDRKSKGSYYTPTTVVRKLCDNLKLKKGQSVYDCCCGTGNFLLQVDADFNDIFGNDIDTMSVKIARLNMALKYGITDKELLYSHITNHDFLTFDDKKRYDFIIGNPPWGADFNQEQKQYLIKNFKCVYSKNIESFSVVIEQALNLLKINGVLSFVLPEAMLNVKTHRAIRQIILENNSITYLEYLGNAFDGVQCPSVILQILHNNKKLSTLGMMVCAKNNKFVIGINREVNSDNFNFLVEDNEYNVIKKIEHIPNKITLENNSQFALGIVTGDNKNCLSHNKNGRNEMVLKGVNLHKYVYDNSDTYITFTPEKFQQVAPVELYRAKEKLFYKFISSELVFAYDNKQTLSLNSCNILIPQIDGLDIKYIMAVLNSSVVQFYFRKVFNSIKVLRSHIENIPIPYIDIINQKHIIRIVDRILKEGCSKDLYDNLDSCITNLYGLSKEEFSLISNI